MITTASTLRRRRLGAELRRLREGSGQTIEHAAATVEISKSALSRIENGLVAVKIPALRALLETYRVPGAEAEELLSLAREAGKREWWYPYHSVLPEAFATFLSFESVARSVQQYEQMIIPGLVQTAEYAEAIARSSGHPEERVPQIVSIRMERQRRLEDLELWFIFEESLLRRPICGIAGMRVQLERLVELSRRPNITIQVLGLEVSDHPGLSGPFSVLEFDGPQSDIAYLESASGSIFLDREEDVRPLAAKFDLLRASAADPPESRQRITHILDEMT